MMSGWAILALPASYVNVVVSSLCLILPADDQIHLSAYFGTAVSDVIPGIMP